MIIRNGKIEIAPLDSLEIYDQGRESERERMKENCVSMFVILKSLRNRFLYSCHENLAHDANKTITMTSLHGLLLKMIQPKGPRDDGDEDDNENMS